MNRNCVQVKKYVEGPQFNYSNVFLLGLRRVRNCMHYLGYLNEVYKPTSQDVIYHTYHRPLGMESDKKTFRGQVYQPPNRLSELYLQFHVLPKANGKGRLSISQSSMDYIACERRPLQRKKHMSKNLEKIIIITNPVANENR